MNKEQQAKEAGALFYTMPSELTPEHIDPLLWEAVFAINKSNWVWTAECCQGHPDETDIHAPWGFNIEPYIRLVMRAEDLGDVAHILLAEAHDEDSATMAPVRWKMHSRPLKSGWMELSVYGLASNSAQRNRACQAFERFAKALPYIPDLPYQS